MYLKSPALRKETNAEKEGCGNRKKDHDAEISLEYSMRFMMMLIPEGYESAAPDAVPGGEAVAKRKEYNKALQKAGVLLALDGLFPPSTGARILYADGKRTVTEGPFAETKEGIVASGSSRSARAKRPLNGPSVLRCLKAS